MTDIALLGLPDVVSISLAGSDAKFKKDEFLAFTAVVVLFVSVVSATLTRAEPLQEGGLAVASEVQTLCGPLAGGYSACLEPRRQIRSVKLGHPRPFGLRRSG